jgi:hypothetical protein
MRSSMLRAGCTALLALAGGAAAQDVVGRAYGFDGSPVPGVVVRAVTAAGAPLVEVLTDIDGRYRLEDLEPGTTLVAQLEGVELDGRVGKDGTGPEFLFVRAPHFLLRGRVTDPAGAPLGALDLRCHAARGWMAAATTDADGAFALRCNRRIERLELDPQGLQHEVRGPFERAAEVDVDLRAARDRFALLQGTARDLRGQPAAHFEVRGIGPERRRFRARTDPEGRYALWVNARIDTLEVRDAHGSWAQVRGPWAGPAAITVDVDFSRAGLVTVTGRVLDAKGQPAANVALYAVARRGVDGPLPDPIGRSNEGGWFRVELTRETALLLALLDGGIEAYAAGPWPERVVEVRPDRPAAAR